MSKPAHRQERVLRVRFGMGQAGPELEELGQAFEVVRERIRSIDARALRKLRHPSRSRRLAEFLEDEALVHLERGATGAEAVLREARSTRRRFLGWACRVGSEGAACFDQALAPCPALQPGKLCGHAELLLRQAASLGQQAAAQAAAWRLAALRQPPRDEPQAAQALFLRLAALRGLGAAVDWRPTWPLGEDYYAR